MKTRPPCTAAATLRARAIGWPVWVALLAPVALLAAVPKSDLTPPHKRQASVELAEQLAARKPAAPLAADLTSPFNPADFDKPDPSERAPAAGGGAPRPGAAPGAGGGSRPGGAAPAESTPPPAASGDREILDMLAGQITPSGMIQAAGRPRLIIKGKLFEIGTRFTVMYKDQEYELELVAIQGNNFTLRYRNEETTRPIKPVR